MSKPVPRIAIVAAEFNAPLVDVMIREAQAQSMDLNARVVTVVKVPGSYEIPLIADRLMRRHDVDVLVALGYIERGETQHGEVMGHVVHSALMELQLDHRKPIGIGIIGPGATPQQAELRKVDYARAAVRAAARSWELLLQAEQES